MPRALVALSLLLAACGSPAASTPAPATQISGLYSNMSEGLAGCHIHVEQLDLDRIEFELFCILGAPSYNSGWLHEEAALEETIAVWDSPYGDCQLIFTFDDRTVNIRQDGQPLDCGFGNGVAANGDFPLTSYEASPMGCVRLDDPCGLHLTPTP